MFNAKYKKGMADAAKAYEAFGQKQTDALVYILDEVRQGNRKIEETITKAMDSQWDNLYDYLESKEKAELYKVYAPFDIKDLGDLERLFLLGALVSLTKDKASNENQQNYIRAVQKYLEIKELPFGVDPMAIENIEDIPSQKAILQTVLEYLRLQDGDGYDETELQQKFLDAFMVSDKVKNEIISHVEVLYGATGAKGLAEKYGYVPEEEPEEASEENVQEDSSQDISATEDIDSDLADKIFRQLQKAEGWTFPNNIEKYLEIEDYYLFQEDGWIDSEDCRNLTLYAISKETGERQFIFGEYGGQTELSEEEIKRLIRLEKSGESSAARSSDSFWGELSSLRAQSVVDGNNAFIEPDEHLYRIDVSAKNVEEVGPTIDGYSLVAAKGPYLIFISKGSAEDGVILFNYQTGKKHILSTDRRLSVLSKWAWNEDKVYAGYDKYSEGKGGIAVISLTDKQCKPLVLFEESDLSIKSIIPYNNTLYVLGSTDFYDKHYNVYAVPCNDPSNYTIIKKNLPIDSYRIGICSRGWIFIENNWEFPLKVFDFIKEELITLGKDCGYSDSVKLHIWSKPSTTYNPYGFCVIGDFVYYTKRASGKKVIIKTSITDPSINELMS